MKNKNCKILDVCCGAKMFWFNKENPNVIFNDIRKENHILCDGRTLDINPDTTMDFRHLTFSDNQFKLVVFDPPHLFKIGEKSYMAKKYGNLGEDWKKYLKEGFDECWRVLADDGILIFKWSGRDIKIKDVLNVFKRKPLFGHPTGRNGNTMWVCFMKL